MVEHKSSLENAVLLHPCLNWSAQMRCLWHRCKVAPRRLLKVTIECWKGNLRMRCRWQLPQIIWLQSGGAKTFLIHWRNLTNCWRIRALGKSCSLQRDWTINFLQGKRRPSASIDVYCFYIQISLVKSVSFWPYHYFIATWSLCANLSNN